MQTKTKELFNSRLMDKFEWLFYGFVVGFVFRPTIITWIGAKTFKILTSGSGCVAIIIVLVIIVIIAYKHGSFSKQPGTND